MEKNNSNIDFSEKDESPYLKYLKEGTKKFYENDFSGSLKLSLIHISEPTRR